MNHTDEEHSSDLEWMLSYGQVDEQALIKFLIHDQYAQVVHLCRHLVDNPVCARQAAAQTLAAAVVRANDYAGRCSAKAWVYRLAVEFCHARYGHLPPLTALALVLQQELGLSINDIAFVLKTSENQIEAELKALEVKSKDRRTPGRPAQQQETGSLPSQSLDAVDFDQIQGEVESLIQLSRQQRRFSARMQEAVLVVLGLVVAAGLGWAALAGLPAPASPAMPTRPAEITTQEMLVYPDGQSQPGALVERRIMYPAEAGDTLTTISEKIGMQLDRLVELNDLPPEKPLQPGQPVVIAVVTPVLSLITPTPVTPVPPGKSISLFSSEDEIRAHILGSQHNWNTLWAEADTIIYGPPGYVGPPKVERQQVWISQPAYSLTLSGGPDGEVKTAIQASAGLVTSLDYQTGTRTSLNRDILVNYTQPVHELLLPTRMRTPFRGYIDLAGEELVAGRTAVVVDLREDYPNTADTLTGEPIRTGRFWVDQVTGVVLRRQWFDPDHPELIVKEVVVTQIRYDLQLSNRFFDPTQPLPTRLYWYAPGGEQDQGDTTQPFDPEIQPEREPIPKQTPPVGLDLAHSSLQFQWTSLAEIDPSQLTQAEVYADGYYLGEVLFGDPRSLSCRRSPNGKLIAFTEWFEEPPYGARPLRWFSLENLSTVYEPLPDLISGNFAFSPDSRRLALFACERSLQSCGINVLDLETSNYQQLAQMAYAGSLGWRPDGEQIAFRGAEKPREESSLWVINASSGGIIYHGALVPESGQPLGRSPLPGWGPVLQRMQRGVEGCIQPPGD